MKITVLLLPSAPGLRGDFICREINQSYCITTMRVRTFTNHIHRLDLDFRSQYLVINSLTASWLLSRAKVLRSLSSHSTYSPTRKAQITSYQQQPSYKSLLPDHCSQTINTMHFWGELAVRTLAGAAVSVITMRISTFQSGMAWLSSKIRSEDKFLLI